jgi:DNA-binding NtrC family response regulator
VEVKEESVDQRVVDRILADSLAPEEAAAPSPAGSLEQIEQEAIRKALQDCHGQRRAAARRLGIAESTLYEKIQRYDLAEVGR